MRANGLPRYWPWIALWLGCLFAWFVLKIVLFEFEIPEDGAESLGGTLILALGHFLAFCKIVDVWVKRRQIRAGVLALEPTAPPSVGQPASTAPGSRSGRWRVAALAVGAFLLAGGVMWFLSERQRYSENMKLRTRTWEDEPSPGGMYSSGLTAAVGTTLVSIALYRVRRVDQ